MPQKYQIQANSKKPDGCYRRFKERFYVFFTWVNVSAHAEKETNDLIPTVAELKGH